VAYAIVFLWDSLGERDANVSGFVVSMLRRSVPKIPLGAAAKEHIHLPLLTEADLEHKPSAGLQKRERLFDDPLMDRKAVRPAVERFARLVVEELLPVFFEATGRNIRRIASDDVDRPLEAQPRERRKEIPLHHRHPIRN